MKFLFLILILFCIVLNAPAQAYKEPTGRVRYQLSGPVKLLVKKLYVYSQEQGERRYFKCTDSIWFNKQGNVTKEVNRDSSGRLAYLAHYVYNTRGQLLSMKSFNGRRKKKDRAEYRYYDEHGRCLIKKEFDWENRTFNQDKYSYNNKGRCVSALSASEDLPLLPRYKTKYIHETKLRYDSLGRLLTIEKFNSSGKNNYVTNFYYYFPQNDSCVVKWRDGAFAVEIIYKAGALLRTGSYNSAGRVESWSANTLDEGGRIISQQSYDYTGKIISDLQSTYSEFDSHNNFGNVLHVLDGSATQYIEQKLKYW